jgi:hypothetical protein
MGAVTTAAMAGSATAGTKLRQFLLLFLVGTVVALAGMIVLPQDRYLRYQALNDHSAPQAYWIYERIHFDPTPIDVAFVGTSRTGRSIHTARLEADLARRGIAAKAVNFYVFKAGRNMHYAVAKELLEHRSVKLLVVELTEWEDRKPHPDFVFLADAGDILGAPLWVNFNYFSDLGRLPGRQVDLFLETTLEKLGLRRPDFVPPPYQGPNLDGAEYLTTLDGKRHYFSHQNTLADMETLRRNQEAIITPAVLPPSLNWLEYRFPRYYVQRILDLAAQHGTQVVFLYVPRYGGPAAPPPYELYSSRARLINPAARVQDFRLWGDETHLNWEGAKLLTDDVAEELAAGGYLGKAAAPPPAVATTGPMRASP